MSKNLKNKRVLVVGGAGSIGSALCRKLSGKVELFILDQNESALFDIWEDTKSHYILANIKERLCLKDIFYKYKFDIVYHAAAMKHVKVCEDYPFEATKTNVYGTRNLAELAVENRVEKFIFISSDKAVNPTSVMGKTKAEGEKICLGLNGKTKFIVVRFGNVMASVGSVIPIFQKAISENRDLVVTHKKMQRYFMGIYEAVDLILEATRLGKGGEIFVMDMGKPIFITELANLMIKLSGKPLGITYSKASKGEKFEEELMSKEEKEVAKKIGKLWIIK